MKFVTTYYLVVIVFLTFSCNALIIFRNPKHVVQETKLLLLTNSMRTKPQKFLNKKIIPYLISNNYDTIQNKYARTVIDDMRKTKKLKPLHMSMYATVWAWLFAKEMGRTSGIGHYCRRYGSLVDRYRLLYNLGFTIGENCDYPNREPLAMDILMDLMIDEGVAGYGHRKNLLTPEFRRVGIAICSHKRYQYNCVMDFWGWELKNKKKRVLNSKNKRPKSR
ncbi:MAG: CAP domain-containing protein [Bacteroidetes bacterium]|nr:MAG: CAP domain-containing protein [Bacteroidota bacterium]